MRKHLLVTLTLLAGAPMCGYMSAHAEEAPQTQSQAARTITGSVLDENNEPVIGATVSVKGKSGVAVNTNFDGNFTIKVVPGATLNVSYVGYKPASAKAADGMTIYLQSSTEQLDQLVVVGYGTQKKANLTGAVSTVDVAKALDSRPVQDVTQALQGAVPGLTILNNSGELNNSSSIRIRGVGTLSNGAVSAPLIVVDGVPVDDLEFLNPSDIESISVMKDAASSSIYGTRGAFGVILVTTKSAKDNEKVSVKYSNNFGWDQATYLPDYSDVPSQLRAALEAKANAGGGAVELFGMYFDQMLPYAEAWKQQHSGRKGYSEMKQFQNMDNVGDYYTFVSDPVEGTMQNFYYADYDIQDIYYNNHAPSQNHAVNVQGTSGKTNYYMSFGYDEKEGIMKINPDKRTRYNVSANVSTWIKDRVQVGARFNFTRRNYTKPESYTDTYQYLWRWGSFFIPSGYIVDPDGTPQDFRVMAMRKQAFNREYTTDRTRMTAYMLAKIYDGLTLNADFTYAVQNGEMGWADHSIYGYNWSGTTSGYIVKPSSCSIYAENSKSNTWTLNVFASYEKTFAADHNIKVMVGANAEETKYKFLSGKRNQLLDESYPELNLGLEAGMSNGWSHWEKASAGYFARINYDYKGIYLLELNGRYDGSSSFPKNDHWAFFPSVSAGYRFSEEDYFSKIKDSGLVTNGKFRVSYGEIGNEAVGSNMFISTVSPVNTAQNWNTSGNDNSTRLTMYQMPTTVSSSLSWERIRTLDLGLDLGLLNNEINFGFDWYQRENTSMLARAKTLPAVFGASSPMTNAGSLRTRGWELSVSYNHRFGEVDAYANFSIGDAVTKVTKWNDDSYLLNSTFEGMTYGDIWGFETDRYFEESDFTGKNSDGSWNFAQGVADQHGLENGGFHYGPGDIKFKDRNGDGVINAGDGTKNNHGDLKVIGNTLPRYEYSFHLGGAWRGFDLDLFFQGVGKRDVWTLSSFNFPMMRTPDLAIYDNQMSYNRVLWNSDYTEITGYEINQGNDYPRLYPGNDENGTIGVLNGKGSKNYYPQSKYLTDMSYLRLKNVTLGYTLPRQLTQKAYIQKLRFYITGANLFLLHKGSGDLPVDPEVNGSNSNLGFGTWGRIAPITRTYSFGLQVTF